jgi:peptide/nickel transport system substrate-binding protein
MKRILYVLVSVLLLAAFALSSCSPTPAPAAAVPTNTTAPAKPLTIALSQEPDQLNPLFSSMSYVGWLSQMVLVGLGRWDDKNNLVPELATDIPTTANGGVSADGLTITWHLRPGLKWSDGQPLTSADVKRTWLVETDPGNAVYTRSGYDKISSIDTPDATTAVLHFSALYPGWQTLFSQGPNNQGALMPDHLLTGKTGLEKDPFVHQPTIASGPYMVKEWVAGDHITMVANPNYWQGTAKLAQINFKIVPNPETALAALKTGDVDMVPDFSESDIKTLSDLETSSNGKIHLRVDAGPEFEHYLFNLGTTASTVKDASGKVVGNSDQAGPCALQDVNVRKAIILGIDRQTIVDTLLAGKTTVPASLWPNSYWTNTALKPDAYDAEKAKTMLDTAGYKPGADGIRHGMCGGQDVKLSFNFETTDKQLRKDMAVAVKDMLLKIGVEFKPTHLPSGTFFGSYTDGGDMATGKYDIAGYTTGFYPDPWNDNFLCSAIPTKASPGGSNYYHVCDPKLEDLFTQANASADPAVRKKAFDAIQQYQYDNALFIPMYVRANVYGYNDRFVFPTTSVISGWSWDTFNWSVKQ